MYLYVNVWPIVKYNQKLAVRYVVPKIPITSLIKNILLSFHETVVIVAEYSTTDLTGTTGWIAGFFYPKINWL